MDRLSIFLNKNNLSSALSNAVPTPLAERGVTFLYPVNDLAPVGQGSERKAAVIPGLSASTHARPKLSAGKGLGAAGKTRSVLNPVSAPAKGTAPKFKILMHRGLILVLALSFIGCTKAYRIQRGYTEMHDALKEFRNNGANIKPEMAGAIYAVAEWEMAEGAGFPVIEGKVCTRISDDSYECHNAPKLKPIEDDGDDIKTLQPINLAPHGYMPR